jgi:hypothetical protein
MTVNRIMTFQEIGLSGPTPAQKRSRRAKGTDSNCMIQGTENEKSPQCGELFSLKGKWLRSFTNPMGALLHTHRGISAPNR